MVGSVRIALKSPLLNRNALVCLYAICTMVLVLNSFAFECKLNTFISIYFHSLLCIQIIRTCMHIMLQTKECKWGLFWDTLSNWNKKQVSSPRLSPKATEKHCSLDGCCGDGTEIITSETRPKRWRKSGLGSNTLIISSSKRALSSPCKQEGKKACTGILTQVLFMVPVQCLGDFSVSQTKGIRICSLSNASKWVSWGLETESTFVN